MSKQHTRSLDGFLATLEKRAQAARTISIAITVVTITLAAITLFFTIREVKERINQENATLERVKKERADAEIQRDSAKKELEVIQSKLDLYRTAVGQLPEERREALLKNAEEEISRTAPGSPKVYLQIVDDNQRGQAQAILEMLKRNGFKVQGIEWVRVQVSGLNQTQVRYFRQEHSDEAQKIVALLRQARVQDPIAMHVSLNAPPNQIEVWFSATAFSTPERPTQPDSVPGQVLPSNSTQGTAFAVIANYKTLEEAVAYARELQARNLPYPIEIYRRDVSRFYVTLGGYLPNAEARKRIAYAKQAGLSNGAYQKNAPNLGENLFR